MAPGATDRKLRLSPPTRSSRIPSNALHFQLSRNHQANSTVNCRVEGNVERSRMFWRVRRVLATQKFRSMGPVDRPDSRGFQRGSRSADEHAATFGLL